MGSDGSSLLAGFVNYEDTAATTVWMAMKLDAAGTMLWQWQDEILGSTNDILYGAAMGQDGSVALAGTADYDFQVIKLDAFGELVWRFEDGTSFYEYADGIGIGEDGSVVVAGGTGGDWNIPALGGWDFAAFKLDADMNLLWKWQGGTAQVDGINSLAMADDGSVVIAGESRGELLDADAGLPGSSSYSRDAFEPNFAAIKLDSEGVEVWRWQDGPRGEGDNILSVSMTEDGSFVLAGRTDGDWSTVNSGGHDFAAVKLDADGGELWRWQDGTSADDTLSAVTVQADGTIILGGYTEGDWNGPNAGGNDFAIVALNAGGEEIWRWQGGSGASGDYLYAMSAGYDGRIVFAGTTYGSYAAIYLGSGDFVAAMLDTSPLATPSPTAVSPSTAVPNQPSAAATAAPAAETNPPSASATAPPAAETNPPSASATAPPVAEPNPPSASATAPPAAEPNPPSASATAPPAAEPNPPSASATAPPAAEPNPLSASATAPPAPRPQSSDMTPVIAGVSSTVAGVVLIALGCFLWKRQLSSDNNANKVGARSSAAVENSNTPAPLGRSLPPPSLPPSYAQVVAATVAKRAEGGGGTAQPFPEPFVAGMPPAVKPTTSQNKDGDARGVSLVQRFTDSTANADNDGGGGGGGALGGGGGRSVAMVEEYAARNTPAVSNSADGGGGAALPVQGGTESTVHVGNDGGGRGGGGRGGGGIANVGIRAYPTTQAANHGGGGSGGIAIEKPEAVDRSVQQAWNVTTSTVGITTGEREEFAPAYEEPGAVSAASVADEPTPVIDAMGDAPSTRRRGSSDGLLLGQAVGDAAQELARNCHIPGVSEAAAAVSILANLVMNTQDANNGTESSLRRCRSIVLMLKRAAKVLGKGGDTTGKAERAMMEDVHDAIFDLVELIKTYQSKNKLSQLMTSTLFRRRQDEMGAVVDRAILGLQLGLHVQVGNDVSAVKKDVGAFKNGMHLYQGSIEEAQSRYLVEARKARRQRKLDQIEIPEDHVAITGELLGKGGFGEVFLADYNGRNAAAKVLYISHDLSKRGENDVLDGATSSQLKRRREKDQRRAFLRELDAMTRLRSQYTVNVYGAVTSLPDRLVLVMELLAGGDLRTLLSNCEHTLAQQQSRQVLGDICAGMAFLHSKDAVHGDVKSANVLLDGTGRAKIGDFGTSRWTHHTMSTGLATFTTKAGKNTQMSLAWSAPEVLHAAGSTKASDVYSFGIVVWEVLSRELPWEAVTHPRDVYIRVVLNDLRPTIPDDAPAEIADVATACWVSEPGDRPTFSAIMEGMKANGWNE